jgi:formylglycine-generating enzyme required for sulfatase activity
MMGSNVNIYASARPIHRVAIRKGFYMGQFEVTQAQWQQVMNNNPSIRKDCESCPVEGVSWEDVQEFIRRLNAHTDGYMYRLPSEAEWEYAARAGVIGDNIIDLDASAWYDNNSGYRTHPVGSKESNKFGLNDMIGNVYEWCQDWYHDTYEGAPTDGSAWLSGGEQTKRVLRGGGCASNRGGTAHFAWRQPESPTERSSVCGFRLVAEILRPMRKGKKGGEEL